MGVKLVSHIKGRPQSGKKVLRRMLGRGGGGGGRRLEAAENCVMKTSVLYTVHDIQGGPKVS